MNNDRFSRPLNEEEIIQKLDDAKSLNTDKKVKWAVKTFKEWHPKRNEKLITSEDELNVYQTLEEINKGDLNFLLKRFVFEVRKVNGEKYPAKTVHELFSMMNHYIQNVLKRHWSLFNDIEFKEARQCLSASMKDIARSGYVSGTKRSSFISNENEEKLWTTNVLGKSSPRQLQNTVIYLMGVHFCLRGGDELRRIRFGQASQLILNEDKNHVPCLIYQEDISKTHQGGLKSIGKSNKRVYCYHNSQNHDRCLPCLYSLFISKRSGEMTTDALFLTPNDNWSSNCTGNKWYKNCPMGKNSFQQVIKGLTSAWSPRALYKPQPKKNRSDASLSKRI